VQKRLLFPLLAVSIVAAAGAAYFLRPQASALPGTLPSILKRGPKPTLIGWPAVVAPLAGGSSGLADPYGLVVDRHGNVFVADGGENNRIQMIAPDGVATTIAGSKEGFADGTGALAAFHTPSGMAIDKDGNLYVADTGNNAIRKVTPQGVVTTIAGGGKAGFADGPANTARFNGPLGVAIDKSGTLYIADTYNDRIRVLGTDGMVRTLAGGAAPGFQDGAQALFDTPCAIALAPNGELYVADTRNSAIRVVARDGVVRTLAVANQEDREALLRRPLSLAISHDGVAYVGDNRHGRIVQVTQKGEVRGLAGVGITFPIGDAKAMRLRAPNGIAIVADGSLVVADSAAPAVRKLVAPNDAKAVSVPAQAAAILSAAHATTAPATLPTAVAPAVAKPIKPFPWPLQPQSGWHEIVGTMGEVRGNYKGESRDHFHNGLDVQGDMGTPVLAILAEKVSSPIPNWAYGDIGEGMAVDTMAYIHMRVGRTIKDASVDPERFQILLDERGKPNRVRIKRGTRFAVGDTLGTVNRMFHVHLAHLPGGLESNPLALAFPGSEDAVAPRIESIELYEAGKLVGKRGKKGSARIVVPRSSNGISIVVGAYDQMDGNASRRRLGLYKVGYQVLRADGTPVPGYEQPQMNIEFNRLPPDTESVKVAYAGNSGITVHGSAVTRFLYVVTNSVRDGHATEGFWMPGQLAAGDYIIRITAADYAGNLAEGGRDLPVTIL
jgi:sugar lactone lactonase YvrE